MPAAKIARQRTLYEKRPAIPQDDLVVKLHEADEPMVMTAADPVPPEATELPEEMPT